jgi:hypothetical protein
MVKGKEKEAGTEVKLSDSVNVTKSEPSNVHVSSPIKVEWADKNIAKNVK